MFQLELMVHAFRVKNSEILTATKLIQNVRNPRKSVDILSDFSGSAGDNLHITSTSDRFSREIIFVAHGLSENSLPPNALVNVASFL